MDPIWVAVVVAVVGPTAITILQGRQRTQERREDWARQDKVAKELREATEAAAARAQDVAVQTQQAAQLLLVNNEAVATQAKAANIKLDVIHTLVNSNMTAALQDGLDASRANLVTLRELIALRVARGEEPDADTIAALKALEDKVGRLAANLKDRIQQTQVADAQIFIAKEDMHRQDEKE